MSHGLLCDASLYVALLEFDRDLRDERQAAGCACGGSLHVSNYPRKPRGVRGKLPEGYDQRLSVCCGRRGCRKRATPVSIRFLSRRVYLAAVFVVVTAMRHGLSPRRVTELRKLIGVSRRTLERWRRWWLETFRATAFWKAEQGRFATAIEASGLPVSLLERFEGGWKERLIAALRFLSPLSIGAAATAGGQGR